MLQSHLPVLIYKEESMRIRSQRQTRLWVLALGVLLGGSPSSELSADPLTEPFLEAAKLTASDADHGDGLGSAVAIDGDTAVLGAKFKDTAAGRQAGAAYVYTRSATGWNEVARLTASDGAADHEFGRAAAIHGDTIVVGAPQLFAGVGAAYVYARDEGGPNAWGEIAKLTASDPGSEDRFGTSVAIEADTIAVGSPQPFSTNGAVYVFTRDAGGWSERAKLTEPSDAVFGDQLGLSVAIGGDTLVAGAPGYEFNGVALVYQGASSNWRKVAKLDLAGGSSGDGFGDSVAIDEDTIVVGISSYDHVCCSSGAGAVFERNRGGPNAWGLVTKLTASDAEADDRLGFSVDISGDLAVLGAPESFNGGRGSAYLFVRDRGGPDQWGELTRLAASDIALSDLFGWKVAVDDSLVLAGSFGHDTEFLEAGAGYLYAACGSDPTILCLHHGRFQVEAEWVDFDDNTGRGAPVAMQSTDSGILWFFDPNNWEVLVKVLDGCGINQHFWVFAAATTNVGYTLKVTDTATGLARSYTNRLGVASPTVTDTNAFATCPGTARPELLPHH